MSTFDPVESTEIQRWLVLEVDTPEGKRYRRITHVFQRVIYLMDIRGEDGARTALKPVAESAKAVQKWIERGEARLGRLGLPPELMIPPLEESDEELALNAEWMMIKPLIDQFESQDNLDRYSFNLLINEHARSFSTTALTLRRKVIRFYYFGGVRLGLLGRKRGVRPKAEIYPSAQMNVEGIAPKRRGPKGILANDLGNNEFVRTQDDIDDMIACYRELLRKRKTTKTFAHVHYLATKFKKRHPDVWERWQNREIQEPVSRRMFCHYIDQEQLEEALIDNVVMYGSRAGHGGQIWASAPGDTYEVDGTGGRIYLVKASDPNVAVGKPNIYLLIDRWSRYVVSVYITLKAPSYEELRNALLIAFTSRRRFRGLGINVDDEMWPVGHIPRQLYTDRGSEFTSKAIEASVVRDLRIDVDTLPPGTPNGKPVVERFIRSMKRKMAEKGLKGVYDERPMDLPARRKARQAENAAALSISECYRALIEIVIAYNNEPHSRLRKYKELTRAGIPPTPQAAYLWGLKNKAGRYSSPIPESDFEKILMSQDVGRSFNGLVYFRDRAYAPANLEAHEIVSSSPKKSRSVEIRMDFTDPTKLYIPNTRGQWAAFEMTPGAIASLGTLTLDEELALKDENKYLYASADHEGRIRRVAQISEKRSVSAATGSASGGGQQEYHRATETQGMKRALAGRAGGRTKNETGQEATAKTMDWRMRKQIEEDEAVNALIEEDEHESD